MAAANKVLAWLPTPVRGHLARLDKSHHDIAWGMIVVFTFIFIGKLAGAAKEMAVAWRYGVSETVDAYLFVFNLVQWPIGILGSVIGAVLVPLAARVRYETPQDLPCFRAELWGASLWLALGLGFMAWISLPWLVQQPWIGLTSRQVELARQMASYLAWVLPLGIVVRLLAAWTMADNRHLNTLLEAAPALTVLAAVLVFGGPEPLIWGTLAGFVLQAVLLYLPFAWRGEAERPMFLFRSAHWRTFFAGFGLMLIGQGLMSLGDLVDQFFAAHLGTGALSTLGYTNRILGLILSLGAISIGRAILPVLSHTHARAQGNIVRIAMRWAALLLGAGLFAAALGIWLAPLAVEILFQRGQFTAHDTAQVAELLRYALVQVPFYFSSMVLVYALLSQSRYKTMAVIGGVNLLTKLILAFVLVPALGLKGLMLATAGVYLVSGLMATRLLGAVFVRKRT